MFERMQKHTVISHFLRCPMEQALCKSTQANPKPPSLSLSLHRVRGEKNHDLALGEYKVNERNESVLSLVQSERKPTLVCCCCLLFFSCVTAKRQTQDLCGFAFGSCLGPGGAWAFCLLTIPYGMGKAYKNVPLALLQCLDLWNVGCSRHGSFFWKSPASDVMPPFLWLCSCFAPHFVNY